MKFPLQFIEYLKIIDELFNKKVFLNLTKKCAQNKEAVYQLNESFKQLALDNIDQF